MKRFRLKPWDLLHLMSDGTPENRKNLERLIARHDGDFSPVFERKKKAIERQVREFESYRPILTQDISTPDFLKVINHYAGIKTEMEKLCAAGYLKFSEDTANSTAKKNNYDIRIFNARLMNRLLFFELWVRNGTDDVNFERIAKEAPDYDIFLVEQRRLKPHTLDESTEKLLNSLHLLGHVERLEYYEEVTSNLRFTIHEHVKVKQKG